MTITTRKFFLSFYWDVKKNKWEDIEHFLYNLDPVVENYDDMLINATASEEGELDNKEILSLLTRIDNLLVVLEKPIT